MLDTAAYILSQYFIVAIFSCSFYGYGNLWEKLLHLPRIEDSILRICLRISIGIGLFIIGMQILGIAGLLKRDVIRALIVFGLILLLLRSRGEATLTSLTATGHGRRAWGQWQQIAAALALFSILLLTAAKPLYPPTEWDELMYHLPHVREWLIHKRLTINEILRYPYFPYNFDLLFAASIGATGEMNSHLMHATAGWLVTLMVFRIAQNNYGPFAAVIAAGIWVSAVQMLFQTSYIELGIALFIFSAAIFFLLWQHEERKPPELLITAAFFLGLASGSKYQTVIYPFFFVIFAAFHERRIKVWAKILLAFLAPCIFWYARNLILTGNPVTPLAGNIFGYYDWNASDFQYQIYDLKNTQTWPRPEIWLSLIALFIPAAWQDRSTRWLMLLSIYAALVWFFTSRLDRYLVPQYPALSLLAAFGSTYLVSRAASIFLKEETRREFKSSRLIGQIVFGMTALVSVVFFLPHSLSALLNVPVSANAKHEYIRIHAKNFEILWYLNNHHSEKKIYQLGLEGGLFYGPRNIYGDHFGKWRYRDFKMLPSAQLYEKLRQNGFEILAVNKDTISGLESRAEFSKYFREIADRNGDKAYELIPQQAQSAGIAPKD